MKKLMLFFFAMVLGVMSSYAEDVVFNIAENPGQSYTDDSGSSTAGPQSVTVGDVTIATGSAIWNATGQYRIYKNDALTVTSTAGNITKIQITCTVAGDAKYGPGCFTVEDGTYTYEEKVGTWEGDAAQVVLTATANQVRATEIVVTLAEQHSIGSLTTTKNFVIVDREGWSCVAPNETPAGWEGAGSGSAAAIIDADATTFYHSDWASASNTAGNVGYQGFLVDMAQDLSNLCGFNVSARNNSTSGHPYIARVYTYADGQLPACLEDLPSLTTETKEEVLGATNAELGAPAFYNSQDPWSYAYNSEVKDGFFIDNKTARYIFFVQEVGIDAWLTVADFNVYQEIDANSQEALNQELSKAIAEAEAAFAANNVGEGLITSEDQLSSPYTAGPDMEPGTSIGCLIDGDTSTYWHTDWSSEPDQHTHYLEVALNEAISGDVIATMSRRYQAANDHVTQFCVHATNDATAEEWAEIGTIDFPFTSQYDENITATFNLPEAYQYLRFYWMSSNGEKQRGYFHMSEFQLSSEATSFNGLNPKSAAALQEALATAKAIENATQKDIDDLKAVLEAYLAGDPTEADPAVVAALEAVAKDLAQAGKVGYPAAESASVVALQAMVAEPVGVTVEEANAAVAALYAEDDIVVPEDGKTYAMALLGGGKLYMEQLNEAGDALEMVEVESLENAPEAAQFTAHVDENGTYFTTSNGQVRRGFGTSVANASNTSYWLKDATTTGLDAEVSELAYVGVYNIRKGTSDELLNQVSATNDAELYGYTYIYGPRGTQDGAAKYGAEVYKYTAGTWDGADRPFYNANFTSAWKFVEVVTEPAGDVPTWTKLAHNANVDGWTGELLAPNTITDVVVEYYESENKIVAKNFMGGEGYNLEIVLDENSNIVSINGETEDPSYGDIGFYTGNSSYYFAYVYPSYDSYVSVDPDNGYITLSGYWYDYNSSATWGYYNLTWAEETEEPEPEPVFAPEAGQAYYVMLKDTELGLDFDHLVSDWDQSGEGICVSSTPTKVYIDAVDGGWTIHTNQEIHMAPCTWSGWAYWSTVVSETAYAWTVEGTDEDFTLMRADGKFANVDNVYDGANVYCDKGTAGHYYLVPTTGEWNGVVRLPEEVSALDELLAYNVEFPYGTVEVSNFGLLGAIFDEVGDPYAIVLAGDDYQQFGGVEVEGGVAKIQFAKIADLRADLQAQAIKKVGAFTSGNTGYAKVYICGKSFKVDGIIYADSIAKEYTVAGNGETTGINGLTINGNAPVYDLNGRRVLNANTGIFIQNGKKIRK